MMQIQGIFFFDVSVIIFMFVLAYLSGRLGDALKIPPLYKTLYVTGSETWWMKPRSASVFRNSDL